MFPILLFFITLVVSFLFAAGDKSAKRISTYFLNIYPSYQVNRSTYVVCSCDGLCVQQAPGAGAGYAEEGAPGPALAVHQQQPTWPEAEAGVEVGGEEAVGRGDDSVP